MRLQGSYTALVTPFKPDGELDEAALRRLIRRQIGAGVAGLVPCGSTGEASTLSHEEVARVWRVTVEEAAGKLPVIAGISANATAKAMELAQEARSSRADGVLVVAPYYNKPTQDGLYRHFKAVAKAAKLPVVVYNIPGRTAVNIQPKTLARLARDIPNIAAVKEASGSLDQVSEIINSAPRGFTVLSGDDSLTLPMMAVGARGVVSVVANVLPEAVSRLCRHSLEGRWKAALAVHRELFGLTKALFMETNPIPVKAALEMLGLCGGRLRLPLRPLPARLRMELRRQLKGCKQAVGLTVLFLMAACFGSGSAAWAEEAVLWQERFFYDALLSARDRLARGQSDPELVPMMRSIASQAAQQLGNMGQIQTYVKVQQGSLRYAFDQDNPAESLKTIQSNFVTLAAGAEQIRNNLYYLTARCRMASSQALPDPNIYQTSLLIITQIQQLQLGLNALYMDAVALQGQAAANPWASDSFFNHRLNVLARSVVRIQESIFSLYNSAYELSWRSR